MLASQGVSNGEIIRGSSVFGVSDLVTKHMVEMESSEGHAVDATRVRLCPTFLVSEVKALRAEVNILKRSLEEEKEARKFGDYLSGEAILQLQTALELDLTQHLTSENNLRQHFEAEMSREMSNSKQTLENRLLHHEIVDKDLRAFRVELDREFKSRFEQFDRRFEEGQHKFKNLSKAVLSKNTHESGISEVMRRLNDERVDYQSECMAKPQKITTVEEQTDSADDGAVDVAGRIARWEVRGTRDNDVIIEHTGCVLEKETSCLWDLFKTFDEDVIIEQTDSALQDGKCCEVTIMM
jgi:hypothetical protein